MSQNVAPQLPVDGPPLLEKAGACARITLNRPSKRNRIELADVPILRSHLADIEADASIRVLALCGAGPVFSAGFDLGKLGRGASGESDGFEALGDAIEASRVPTIAAIGGSIYGGAADLALACDFRVGVRGMQVLIPAARIGLCYYGGGLRRFVDRLGAAAARRVFLRAEKLGDAELLASGFLDEVVEPGDLDARVQALAGALAEKAPLAVQGMKSIMTDIARGTFDPNRAEALHARAMASRDLSEGLAAFAEKRPAVFFGQ